MFPLGSHNFLGGCLHDGSAQRRAGHRMLGGVQSVDYALTGHFKVLYLCVCVCVAACGCLSVGVGLYLFMLFFVFKYYFF